MTSFTKGAEAMREMAAKYVECLAEYSKGDTLRIANYIRALPLPSQPEDSLSQSADDKDRFVDRFLAWPLPKSVSSDGCATDPNYPHPRCGTNLLTADEAGQMFEQIVKPMLDAKQAKIDALMLEYCPEEMTPEQVEEWGKHQRAAKQPEDSSARGVVVPLDVLEEINRDAWSDDKTRMRLIARTTDRLLAAAPQQNAAPVSERGLSEKAIRFDERARCAARIYAAAGDSSAKCYSATDAADLLSERNST